DPVVLFLSEPAARSGDLAAVLDRRRRTDDAARARRRRHVAVSPRDAERRAAADELCLEERTQGDYPARGDPASGNLYRHAPVRRRAVPNVAPRASDGGVQRVDQRMPSANPKWLVARSFLLSLCFYVGIVWVLSLSKGLLVASFAALIAPFLPVIFVFTDWGSVQHGTTALQMLTLSGAAIIMVSSARLYPSKRIVLLGANLVLIFFWVMSFGILGMVVT